MPVYTDAKRKGIPRVLPRSDVSAYFGARCKTSALKSITVPHIGKMYVHKRVAEAFVSVFADLEAAGKLDLIDRGDYGGTYNCREVRSGGAPSPHSWAIAVDLNVHHHATAAGKETKLAASNYKCRPDRIAPSLRELAPYFYRHGFAWGGDWTNTCDPMHFEATEITVALLEGGHVPEAFTARLKREGLSGAPPVSEYERGCFLDGKRLGEFLNVDGTGYVPVRVVVEACGLQVQDWKPGRVDLMKTGGGVDE